jgi:translocation and assembly module TamA
VRAEHPGPDALPRRTLGAALLAAGLCCTAASAQEAQGTAPGEPALPAAATTESAGESATTSADGAAAREPLFQLEVLAPAPLAELVRRHSELQRFQGLPDLSRAELERLLLTAPDDIRALLGSQGYFSPTIDLRLVDPPAAGSTNAAGATGAAGHTVRVTIEPGPQTRVAEFSLVLHGDVLDNPEAQQQRSQLLQAWSLPAGRPFTQQAWDDAKSQALRALARYRYPQARIVHSLADIDPASGQARLVVELDSGPAHRFGATRVEGSERYDTEMVLGLLRLAGVRPDQVYDEGLLQLAQQRLLASGYYESAFVLIDAGSDPAQATVVVRVREALRQKFVAGLGASTDNGARLSLEHVHHRLPLLDWRAVTKLKLERRTSTLSEELGSPVDELGWRNVLGAQLQRQEDQQRVTDSQQLRAGRAQLGSRQDRQFLVQYDRSQTTDPALAAQAAAASSVSASYGWTRRSFDDLLFPTRGQGLALEIGAGLTLSQENHPFLRARTRWQGYLPAGDDASRSGRWSLRFEGGAVWARDDSPVPATQLFLAGGEGSVRGYPLRGIGVPRADGGVDPGRLLALASLEWQLPLWIDGRRSEWEGALFLDAGAVADHSHDLDPRVGVGAGLRYRSPVGPLQLDLAWGAQRKALRLHMSVGFTF